MKKNLIKVTIILSMLLLTLIPLSVNAATVYTENIGPNVKCVLDSTGTITLSGTGETYNTTIAPKYYCSQIKKVVVQEGVTSIGNGLFNECTNLTSVSLSNTVTSIGGSAFYNCNNLSTINMSTNLVSIGSTAFYNCKKLDNIIMPESLTEIGYSAFQGCTNLKNITLSNNITTIPKDTFYGCSSLENIILPNKLIAIGEGSFSSTGINSIEIPNTLKTIGKNAFSFTKLKSVNIPNSVETMENQVFYNCTDLTNVILPSNITTVKDSTFYNCSNLTNVVIPDSVKSIEGHAFYNCKKLKYINIPKSVTNIERGAFYNCNALEKIYWDAVSVSDFTNTANVFYAAGTYGNGIEVIYGDDVEKIPAYTFYNCYSYVKNIILGKNISIIGRYAFKDCYSIVEIALPSSLKQIEEGAFSGCDGIKTVNYNGYKKDWMNIEIGRYNTALENSTIVYLPVSIILQQQSNKFYVTPTGVENGNRIIFVCYNGDRMVYVNPYVYAGETTIPFTTSETYDKVKVMVWENLETCFPLCVAEEVPLN